MATWEAWWSGDTDQLAAHYGGSTAGGFFRPAQLAGGVVGRLARFWWGRPPARHEPDAKLHVPLAGDICRTSANLLFGEPFAVSAKSAETSTLLDVLLDEGTQSALLCAAEMQAALGGVYLRPVADPSISERAWLDAVAPDQAIPVWRWGRLSAVTFWHVVHESHDGKTVLRHFEAHEPGRIVHALYEGTGDDVGRPVPLAEHQATAPFAELVDEDSAITSDWPRLAATYIPNALPNPRWRRKPLLAPMGRSDLDGIEPMLDALDEVYSSWMRDVRLAKGRIIVGDSMLDDLGPGRGARFDPDKEAYAVIAGMDPKDVPLTVAQFGIRVEEHRATAHELMTTALRHAGYALITLGEVEGGQAITATEVRAKGQLSFVTLGRKRGIWTPRLERDALPALCVFDAEVYGRPMPDLDEIHVEWPDSVADDLASIAATIEVLARAEAISTETKVRMAHPDWGDTEVNEEVAKIENARAPALGVPFDYGDGTQPAETDDRRANLGGSGDDEEVPA